MSLKPKILAFAGSLRKNSFNKKIAQIAALGAKEAGASVTYIDLKDYPIPLYDEEIEEKGLPENVLKLKELFSSHEGFIIASPEYNGSFSAVLKNTIDWISRKKSAEDPSLSCFKSKMAVLLSASPGPLGGVRGLIALRQLLATVHTLVLPEQKTIAYFNPKENLSEKDQKSVEKLGALLTEKLLLLNL